MRNPVTSIINIVGLAVGMACAFFGVVDVRTQRKQTTTATMPMATAFTA